MDLTAIQEKLRRQAQFSQPGSSGLPQDWPPTPSLMISPKDKAAPPTPQLANTVQTLRRRSLRSLGTIPSSAPSLAMSNPSTDPQIDPDSMIWQQQLRTMVDTINRLSHEQELVIATLATTGTQLLDSARKQLRPGDRFPLPTIDLNQAVTTTATLDGQGNVYLGYKPIQLKSLDLGAHQLAAQLRERYGPDHQPPNPLAANLVKVGRELRTLLGEPWSCFQYVWRKWLFLGFTPSPQRRKSTSNIKPVLPSWVDSCLWVGSGVIGRLVLNLLLSAFPTFWPLAVLVITGILTYALYNTTLATRPNFGVAIRVLLLVAGLGLGGYL
ncbi:MAG: hypothetical protein VKO01_03290 [Cyanobacteriota bacterium]|jgi:hypothetical protein|nr:hypothetical protein [Cyanobacteriota bacterium]